MGITYLNFLYRTLYKHPDVHILLGAKKQKELVGVITVTLDLKQTQAYMSASIPSQIPAMLQAIVSGRVSVMDIVRQMTFERHLAARFSHPFVEILTLFVEKSHRKTGIGKKLIQAAEHKLKNKRICRLYVDTQITNTSARAFYETIGFGQEAIIMDSVILSKVWKKN
jgi:ribosomal protein S18 acetylase RimI-like enzyme